MLKPTASVQLPPKKKHEGEPISIKKNWLQFFDIMKHSAKYEHFTGYLPLQGTTDFHFHFNFPHFFIAYN